MTTIAELITASLKISVQEQTRAIVGINKDLIRLLAAEYKFDAEDAIARFIEDTESSTTVEVAKSSKGKKSKKQVDPNAPVKPKKATNAFMLFTSAMRDQVKADHPELKPKEISKKMGELWAELSDEDKEPYVEKAEKLKAEYLEKKAEWEKEMEEYKNSNKMLGASSGSDTD